MLARLKGMMQSLQPESAPAAGNALPPWDAPPDANAVAPAAVPLALPVEGIDDTLEIPVALPVPAVPMAVPVAEPIPERLEPPTAPAATAPVDIPLAEPIPLLEFDTAAPPATVILCQICGSPRRDGQTSCTDCGYYFTADELAPGKQVGAVAEAAPPVKLQNRFELQQLLGERGSVARFRGLDHGDGKDVVVPVIVLRESLPGQKAVAVVEPLVEATAELEILPAFDDMQAPSMATAILPPRPAWPSLAWECTLLRTLEQPALPRIVASFVEGGAEYLVEEVPAGRSLWDAWDDPQSTSDIRFGWLVQAAEAMHGLHHCGAMFEGVHPDLIVIAADGQARFCDLADLLPLPMPPDTPIRGNLYSAPELLLGKADARADLYGFGAMLYALHVGRELAEIDFDHPGHPKPFVPRFPDIHPAFGRLLSKTFRREVEARFPTDEAGREDSSGFLELIRTLNVLRRTLDNVRLEIAAWTTTGMVRSGNEDAFALLHACESRQDDVGESALLLLADGMGGYEAGEVAAALAIQALRQNLVAQKPLSALGGVSHFPSDALTTAAKPEGHAAAPLDVAACKQLLCAALKDANRQVFGASRTPGARRRGMGCTAEVVYVDGRNVVVGHVGDSRTYHLHEGRMIQLTRDHTLVNRLVELGTLTAEEAETHPRRNELQQAIGGQPDVDPGLYSNPLKPGDWVVVCSDGLSNHISAIDLKQMLQSEAQSAEMAARRLVNLANIEGATDNATVVVVRAT